MNQILINLFNGKGYGNVYVTDGEDMTMTITFTNAPSAVDLAIISTSGVFPRAGWRGSNGGDLMIIADVPTKLEHHLGVRNHEHLCPGDPEHVERPERGQPDARLPA